MTNCNKANDSYFIFVFYTKVLKLWNQKELRGARRMRRNQIQRMKTEMVTIVPTPILISKGGYDTGQIKGGINLLESLTQTTLTDCKIVVAKSWALPNKNQSSNSASSSLGNQKLILRNRRMSLKMSGRQGCLAILLDKSVKHYDLA